MATLKQNGIILPSWINDVVAGTVGGWAQVVSGTTSLSFSLSLSLSHTHTHTHTHTQTFFLFPPLNGHEETDFAGELWNMTVRRTFFGF
jgi:hypothetical protein